MLLEKMISIDCIVGGARPDCAGDLVRQPCRSDYQYRKSSQGFRAHVDCRILAHGPVYRVVGAGKDTRVRNAMALSGDGLTLQLESSVEFNFIEYIAQSLCQTNSCKG
jgi:hypothetical protein